MPKEIKQKEHSFGGCALARVRPSLTPDSPPKLNVVISFEEALKLHLSLGQLLGRLNGHNRSTRAGKRSAATLCLHLDKGRIALLEGKLPENGDSDEQD